MASTILCPTVTDRLYVLMASTILCHMVADRRVRAWLQKAMDVSLGRDLPLTSNGGEGRQQHTLCAPHMYLMAYKCCHQQTESLSGGSRSDQT